MSKKLNSLKGSPPISLHGQSNFNINCDGINHMWIFLVGLEGCVSKKLLLLSTNSEWPRIWSCDVQGHKNRNVIAPAEAVSCPLLCISGLGSFPYRMVSGLMDAGMSSLLPMDSNAYLLQKHSHRPTKKSWAIGCLLAQSSWHIDTTARTSLSSLAQIFLKVL